MKVIRKNSSECDQRNDGRRVFKLLETEMDASSVVFYLCEVPGGRFRAHYHAESTEFIWFPKGGKIEVNGVIFEMGEWDGVLLDPGDVHGYDGVESDIILHFAVKLPACADKIEVDSGVKG